MKIKISDTHIKMGKRNSSRFNPIALALKDALGYKLGSLAVGITPKYIYIEGVFYEVPRVIVETLKKYDNGGRFTLTAVLVDSALKDAKVRAKSRAIFMNDLAEPQIKITFYKSKEGRGVWTEPNINKLA